METFLIDYLPYILIILLISLVDFVVIIRSRIKKQHIVETTSLSDDDFTILVPIFGDLSYLRNVSFLKEYASHVILCTTTKESFQFNKEIENIVKENGFKLFRSDVVLSSKTQEPNPWDLFSKTLHDNSHTNTELNKETARDEIIRDSFSIINTEYCIFLDGDTIAHEKINKLIHAVKEKKFEIASVRVLASKTETLIEKLQAVEYELAMDARRIYPWLTSGACMVAKTEVIKDIMRHHSLFFSGGDIEIGKLARMLKYRVGHMHFNFYTDVPPTFRTWFKQRMDWFGGGFRHAVVNIHQYTWKHPLFYFYTTFLVYLLTPLRWYGVIKYPLILPIVICLYWILICTFHWEKRKWFYILFPFYALTQVMIIVPLGVYTYFKMAIRGQNIGVIRLRPDVNTEVRIRVMENRLVVNMNFLI